MNTFVRFPGGLKKALTLSYDDAVIEDKKLIEIMQRHGLKGTFNINTGLFAKESGHRRMTEQEAVDLYTGSGMEVAVHSYTHPFLEQLPLHLAFEEICKDRQEIERLFGGVCRGMAYPMGTFSNALADRLKDLGILYSRTTVATEKFDLPLPADWARLPATCHHNHPRLMELARKFAEREIRWRSELFYLWGHSYEFDDNDNWNVIEEFASYMGGREEIWYATNIEIFSYLEAFHQLQFSADGRRVYNPTLFTLYFSTNSKDLFKVEPGQTLDF